MRDRWEILLDAGMLSRAERFMRAMAAAAPVGSSVERAYTGRARLLMLYGAGSPARLPVVRAHVAAGGRAVMWDLGYWDRDSAMRLSIDELHPTPEWLDRCPAEGRRPFDLREDASPSGPVMIVGLGRKSLFAYSLGHQEWEGATLADLRRRFPRRDIVWRPKGEARPLAGLPIVHGPIEGALRGCSLVVVRHSNVAVDAALAGIPVECEGGAAVALYRGGPSPSPAARAAFLARLSWLNWRADEAPAAWAFLRSLVGVP